MIRHARLPPAARPAARIRPDAPALWARSAIGMVLGLALQADAATAADATPDIPAGLAARYGAVAAPGALRTHDGWYFLAQELHAYAAGSLSAARRSALGDPLEAIAAFSAMAATAGIRLLVVPVPGKIAIYPDQLDPAWSAQPRFDAEQAAFFQELRGRGVEVLDLLPAFVALRAQGTAAYCRQDSHWSPAGMQLAAAAIQRWMAAQAWYAGSPLLATTRVAQTVDAHGDLAGLLADQAEPAERLQVMRVEAAGRPVPVDRQSPIVLMGDSSTLVYHGDGLLAEAAGLPDQLAALCARPIDLVGVLGGGANGSRMILARRRDDLAGKKCLVWVFAARELSESGDGWKMIPVVR
jgi:hypothetical protein